MQHISNSRFCILWTNSTQLINLVFWLRTVRTCHMTWCLLNRTSRPNTGKEYSCQDGDTLYFSTVNPNSCLLMYILYWMIFYVKWGHECISSGCPGTTDFLDFETDFWYFSWHICFNIKIYVLTLPNCSLSMSYTQGIGVKRSLLEPGW